VTPITIITRKCIHKNILSKTARVDICFGNVHKKCAVCRVLIEFKFTIKVFYDCNRINVLCVNSIYIYIYIYINIFDIYLLFSTAFAMVSWTTCFRVIWYLQLLFPRRPYRPTCTLFPLHARSITSTSSVPDLNASRVFIQSVVSSYPAGLTR